MLTRVVPFLRGVVASRQPYNYTPRLPCNYAQFYHKEISNVQVNYFFTFSVVEKFLLIQDLIKGQWKVPTYCYCSDSWSKAGLLLGRETAGEGGEVSQSD